MTGRPTALVLRALGLGDFFTGLPALSLLRAALPGHEIVLAAPRPYHSFALLGGSVDRAIHGHELTPLVDAPNDAHLAFDLHGNGPASRALLLQHDPQRLIAFEFPGGPRWRPDEHEVHRWCRLVAEGLGAERVGQDPAAWPEAAGALPLPANSEIEPGLTIVHPGAAARSRQWPADRFVSVARTLTDRGHQVIVTGGAGEDRLAASVAEAAGARARTDLSLAQLFALVAGARMVISGDTGIAHVATNYRTPSVVLFGPVSPAVWGPPPRPLHQVLWHGRRMGDPHGDSPDPALLTITVPEVLAAVERADERSRYEGAA